MISESHGSLIIGGSQTFMSGGIQNTIIGVDGQGSGKQGQLINGMWSSIIGGAQHKIEETSALNFSLQGSNAIVGGRQHSIGTDLVAGQVNYANAIVGGSDNTIMEAVDPTTTIGSAIVGGSSNKLGSIVF